MLRRIRHLTEATAAWILYTFFAFLPVDLASALGGWIGRAFGPSLSVSDNARRNLRRTYPGKSDKQIEEIVLRMWDNLGRTAGEHPHIDQFNPYLDNSRVEVVGTNYFDILKKSKTPGLFFSGHIANWEISSLGASQFGLKVHLVYRQANNPFFDKLIQKSRNSLDSDWYPKGAEGAKAIVRTLKMGESIAMLVDQKMNDGISVPFLGLEAMTAPALAELALRYNCVILPVRVERLNGAKFRVTLYPPVDKPNSGDKDSDILAIMTEINQILGDWINERPEQWLWVHNRWPD